MSGYFSILPVGLRGRLFLCLFSLAVLVVPACQPAAETPTDEVLATMDSVLSELGGTATTDLSRPQRWRMISSIGAGLPPANFDPDELPEPLSRGAGLMRAYCVQCHEIPTPRMHSAADWPILMRRMMLRATTLHEHMGGPLTTELVGDIRMSGLASTFVPSPEDRDTLIAYLQRNALQVVQPGELGDDPEARFYAEKCSICHGIPSPAAHADWGPVLDRMQVDMALQDVAPLEDSELERIAAFLADR